MRRDARPLGCIAVMIIDSALVQRLVESQFPRWAHLPIRPVAVGGWDNRTFHLGAEMTVRLPSAEGYAPQVQKEQRWLPVLGPQLPLPIPTPLALGQPQHGFPWNWSIYSWLLGTVADFQTIEDLPRFAADLAGFLAALQRIDPREGPPPGVHTAFRGAPVDFYDAEVRRSILVLADELDSASVMRIWESAINAPRSESAVWFHGDVAVGNLLTVQGRLAAVIDFGCAGVGDPACDLVIAWTLFSGESRDTFRSVLAVDPEMWARGRGWALWKALITLAEETPAAPAKVALARRVVRELLADS